MFQVIIIHQLKTLHFHYHHSREISVHESKAIMQECTLKLAEVYPLEQVLFTRAGTHMAHFYLYLREKIGLSVPVFLQYGNFNSGKILICINLSVEIFY